MPAKARPRSLSPLGSDPFRQTTYAIGFRPELSYDKALQLAGGLEAEEILRELATGR